MQRTRALRCISAVTRGARKGIRARSATTVTAKSAAGALLLLHQEWRLRAWARSLTLRWASALLGMEKCIETAALGAQQGSLQISARGAIASHVAGVKV